MYSAESSVIVRTGTFGQLFSLISKCDVNNFHTISLIVYQHYIAITLVLKNPNFNLGHSPPLLYCLSPLLTPHWKVFLSSDNAGDAQSSFKCTWNVRDSIFKAKNRDAFSLWIFCWAAFYSDKVVGLHTEAIMRIKIVVYLCFLFNDNSFTSILFGYILIQLPKKGKFQFIWMYNNSQLIYEFSAKGINVKSVLKVQ